MKWKRRVSVFFVYVAFGLGTFTLSATAIPVYANTFSCVGCSINANGCVDNSIGQIVGAVKGTFCGCVQNGGEVVCLQNSSQPFPPTGASIDKLQYVPLEPLTPNAATYPDLASYLSTAYSVLLTLGALIAVITFTIGGVVYMTSDAVGKKSAAVERMKAAVWGLLLLAASYLILQTINPNLLNFNLSTLGQVNNTNTANPGENPGGTANTLKPGEVTNAYSG